MEINIVCGEQNQTNLNKIMVKFEKKRQKKNMMLMNSNLECLGLDLTCNCQCGNMVCLSNRVFGHTFILTREFTVDAGHFQNAGVILGSDLHLQCSGNFSSISATHQNKYISFAHRVQCSHRPKR
jgi:hypothetical protein